MIYRSLTVWLTVQFPLTVRWLSDDFPNRLWFMCPGFWALVWPSRDARSENYSLSSANCLTLSIGCATMLLSFVSCSTVSKVTRAPLFVLLRRKTTLYVVAYWHAYVSQHATWRNHLNTLRKIWIYVIYHPWEDLSVSSSLEWGWVQFVILANRSRRTDKSDGPISRHPDIHCWVLSEWLTYRSRLSGTACLRQRQSPIIQCMSACLSVKLSVVWLCPPACQLVFALVNKFYIWAGAANQRSPSERYYLFHILLGNRNWFPQVDFMEGHVYYTFLCSCTRSF